MNIPRNEYPRPQLVRDNWLCLNGEWEFEIDNSLCGMEKEYFKRTSLDGRITVPFCPESLLSGVNNKDFMNCVWYRRDLELPQGFSGKRIILHFGAVDYHAHIYVNGEKVCEHKGGYTPFCADITEALKPDKNYITVCAYDDTRSGRQPCGKQSHKLASHGCFYTRTTGIWQTVWLEAVSELYIRSIKLTPDISTPSVGAECSLSHGFCGSALTVKALWNGKTVGSARADIYSDTVALNIPLSEKHLWAVGKGDLYDLELTLEKDGAVCDKVSSYFGLRSVCLDGRSFRINGETVFGRWVLDQGFYPDGIYTAPTDEALKADIVNSMRLGFNGARLHEKIFEPRFLYWADRLGYLCWGEHGNWGLDVSYAKSIHFFLPEWIEAIERDYSHPSIIGWCPFNETWDCRGRKQYDDVIRNIYRVTKALDTTRPVIDTSGNYHTDTDIFDVHDYEQDPEKFAPYYANIPDGIIEDHVHRNEPTRQTYDGKKPVFISEYGGIRWNPKSKDGCGYGNVPQTEEEFIDRYRRLTHAITDNKYILGFCYTQLYDVEQERNGLMTYEREFKFDPDIICDINKKRAAIEDE